MSKMPLISKTEIEKISWAEFRDAGMLWYINRLLHVFGLAICLEIYDNGESGECYPAKVKYRGFSESDDTCGYEKVDKYIKEFTHEH